MINRVRIRPSKPASAMGMIVGLAFVGIGLFVAIPTFGAFGIFWTLIAAGIALFHALNVFSERGVATTEIDFEGKAYSTQSEVEPPFDERLRKLEELYKDQLITAEEYQHKRTELLRERW